MSISMLEGRIQHQARHIGGLLERIRELEAHQAKTRGELEEIEKTLMKARHEASGLARTLLIIDAIRATRTALGRNRKHRK
jgi:hypothetical protein